MNLDIVERTVTCPFCGERTGLMLDLSAGRQSYIEDCQICCQPMQISFEVDNDECSNLEVGRAA